MYFKEKEIILKNNIHCLLRSPNRNDACSMLEFLKITSQETDFMLRYPEEIDLTPKQQEIYLSNINHSSTNMMIAAFISNQLVGNASIVLIGTQLKVKHRAEFGISIKKEFWNLGIGQHLIEEILIQAKQIGYRQVELSVFADNSRAIHLYQKCGFEKWGVIKDAYKLKGGSYHDEILMGRKL